MVYQDPLVFRDRPAVLRMLITCVSSENCEERAVPDLVRWFADCLMAIKETANAPNLDKAVRIIAVTLKQSVCLIPDSVCRTLSEVWQTSKKWELTAENFIIYLTFYLEPNTVEPYNNVFGCNGVPVIAFSSTVVARSLIDTMYWIPACCVRAIRLFCILCCICCAMATPKTSGEAHLREAQYVIAGAVTALAHTIRK